MHQTELVTFETWIEFYKELDFRKHDIRLRQKEEKKYLLGLVIQKLQNIAGKY